MDKMLADLDLTVTSDDDLDLNTDLVTSLATMETLEYANECVVMVSWLRCWFCTYSYLLLYHLHLWICLGPVWWYTALALI